MINFCILDVGCQGMALSKLRVFVAEELSSSLEQLLRQKLVLVYVIMSVQRRPYLTFFLVLEILDTASKSFVLC